MKNNLTKSACPEWHFQEAVGFVCPDGICTPPYTKSQGHKPIPDNVLELATQFVVAIRYMTTDKDPEMVSNEITIDSRGGDRWSICWAGMCWKHSERKWVYESSPSNRTDDFIANTRMTLENAFTLAPTAIANAIIMQGPQGQWIESRLNG